MNKIEDLEGEIWEDIPDYVGLYKVSNLGRVKSLLRKEITKNPMAEGTMIRTRNEKILKYGLDKDGYPQAGLCKDGKAITKKIHKLVAIVFIANADNSPQINHRNGIKVDNRVGNLEWCSQSYNMKHAYKTGLVDITKIQGENHWNTHLTSNDILKIRKWSQAKTYSSTEMSEIFNTTRGNINGIISKRYWKHI